MHQPALIESPERHVDVTRDPWQREAVHVAADLGTNIALGLTTEEAAARLARFGPNELEAGETIPAWRKFLAQFQDPLIYLLFVAVGISIVAWVFEGAHGIPYEAIVYPDVDHAFMNDTSAERYNAATARQAWAKTVAFLKAGTGTA